jgi:hypothetical protein
MASEETGERPAKRNPIWILIAVLLMFICAFCAGEWYMTGKTFVSLSMRADLANLAQHVRERSKEFGGAALIAFLASVFVLGFTDRRSGSDTASPLRKYLRALVFTVFGTLGFLILDVLLFGLIFGKLNLQ